MGTSIKNFKSGRYEDTGSGFPVRKYDFPDPPG